MSWADRRWDGPDCGLDGCALQIGHIGEHKRDPADGDLDTEFWWAQRWAAQYRSDGSGRLAASEMTARANELGRRYPSRVSQDVRPPELPPSDPSLLGPPEGSLFDFVHRKMGWRKR